jgi:hypothetical protein
LHRPSRLDDAILEFGHAGILELGYRQVNRRTRDQERGAADHHSKKGNAEFVGQQALRF